MQVSRQLRASFTFKRCSPDVNTRCVGATRRSPRDISSTLPVRRANLRRFTRRSRRWYLLCENANELSDRVWMGPSARHVSMGPSRRRQHTVPRRASKGTAAYPAIPHIDGVKIVPTGPVNCTSDTCLAYQRRNYACIVCARPWTVPSACASAACAGVSKHGCNAIGQAAAAAGVVILTL